MNKFDVYEFQANYHLIWSLYESTSYNRQTSNIRRILVVNKIIDHSDVVGASPVGVAPTTSSFLT